MMARDRRYGKSSVKARVGIATAVLVGGAVAAGAVIASNHGVASTATSAAYSSGYASEGTLLSSAMNNWGWSRQSSYSQLARLTQARTFSQTWHQGRMLAVQRGIVVLVTVTVTVRLVLATWTVTVCGAGAGVSMVAAVSGLPASSVVAGIMLPETMACRVALVFAVSACVPAVVFDTSWILVLPDSSHRCSEPLADCRIRNLGVTRTTMPRCTASILP